ncbi:MAG TPA: Zn-dependent protease with chaperone function [Cyanobacteria bacterium UBA11149]|nr:Zn-dependent protease with chaperone function [Cyanobacteria bacterium UBA11366]HBK63002.1 Zn-dependent protease with chaperone function [Cyanobacteria bacterium UBA11166]HBR77241.1 Zn-dependent protease with chaperone function [Cyanobacteria bacterium UBA11159]HBS69354.1 Zn-dependent protease with chaperone function [Cyanobacteria bacterium UBA11153]HBW90125.1 Zn-dependent protease with chaperone function [Cyanobacteria bacterium UBA11149]HCA97871.1 Zn-dependent protease with chaperone fun
MNSIPNPSLDIGMIALEEGDYPLAIAHLSGVCELELDEVLISRAAVGLVKAYRQMGDGQKAIAICQILIDDPNPEVGSWASTTLSQLMAEFPPNTNPSGFMPLENPLTSNPTGFIPLKETSAKPNIPQWLANSTQRLFSGGKSAPPPVNPPQPQPKSSSQLPIAYTPPTAPSLFTSTPRFRNLGRAESWKSAKPPKLLRFWCIEIGSAIAFFYLCRFWLQFLMGTTNQILVKLPLLEPIQLLYRDPTPTIWVILGLLLIFLPWLMDLILKQFYGLQPFSLSQLTSHSPEAAKMIQRFCRQHRLPLPRLEILPTDAPLAITYGNLPRTARIVISQGLLSQLTEDEIATIYGGELGHIKHRDFILMSLFTLTIQIPYLIYWQTAKFGEALSQLILNKLPAYRQILPPRAFGITSAIASAAAMLFASLSYCTYYVLRLPLLWFSRIRPYYSDRIAIETTGNPNGLTRALLKMSLGISEDIQNNRQTSQILESFDLMLPVGYQQAIPLSTSSGQISFEAILHWDCINPYRDWLSITTSHPLIGDRLHSIARYSHHWRIGTELDLPNPIPPIRNNKDRLTKLQNSHTALPLFHTALLYGIILGIAMRSILWLIGIICDRLNIWQLIWLHNAQPFLDACIFIAFSLVILISINKYFPDIKPSTTLNQPNLGELIANPHTLPPQSQPIQLTGKLLGKIQLLNWLSTDLILQTPTGLIKLHHISYLGALGNLLPQKHRPSDLIGEKVTITGWFRRGATPWIDIETIKTSGGKISQAYYPGWLTILAFSAAIWGAYLIWQV